jgi:CRP-like cAMP-binding protein
MMDREDVVGFLAKVPMFRGLRKRQLERLAGRVVHREYEAGSGIVSQGQSGAGLYVLVTGMAEVILARQDGARVTVNTLGPTDFFGELALLDDEPRTASVVAVEETQCLVLSQWEFLAALREDADMGITVLRELARRFRRTLQLL